MGLLLNSDGSKLFSSVRNIIYYLLICIPLIVSVYLITKANKTTLEKKRRILGLCGYFFLIIYIFIFIASFFHSKETVWIKGLVNLITIFILFIGLKPFLIGFLGDLPFTKDYKQALNRIITQYNISAREKEIIEMILRGKNNREIEKVLFLSPHTIKNHIYHIYQKTRVSSRVQLVNLIFGNGKL